MPPSTNRGAAGVAAEGLRSPAGEPHVAWRVGRPLVSLTLMAAAALPAPARCFTR